jgi:hypothetical protein
VHTYVLQERLGAGGGKGRGRCLKHAPKVVRVRDVGKYEGQEEVRRGKYRIVAGVVAGGPVARSDMRGAGHANMHMRVVARSTPQWRR